jgi:hypothetical protein
MKPRLHHASTLALISLVGCGGGASGFGGAPSATHLATQLDEVEITQDNGTVTVDRFEVAYDGQRLDEMKGFRNGASTGTTRFTYGADGIELVDYVDKDGDAASERWTYAGGNVASVRYEIEDVFTWVNQISYDAALPSLPSKMSATTTQADGLVSTDVVKFDYDDSARIEKSTQIHEDGTDTTEFDYTDGDRLDRTTTFKGSEVITTEFAYTPDGQLLSIAGSDGVSSNLEYDADGRISVIRTVRPDGLLITYRYKYGTGLIAGVSFAPSVAFGRYFDLAGISHSAMSAAHEWFETFTPGDVQVAGGGTCQADGSDVCQSCLADACCSEALACGTGTACRAFADCVQNCPSEQCVSTCRSMFATGAANSDALDACAADRCQVCF